MISRSRFFTGLFLISMTMLMLQIIETRILSVVSMYYLAFLSISMAMLGMTAGALLVYFKLGQVTPQTVSVYLSRLSCGFAVAILGCFLLQIASPLPLVKNATVLVMWLKLLFLLAGPFTIAGIIVSLALTRSPFPVGLTYGVDLFGAAFGCLAVLALLNYMDATSAVFLVAALAAIAAVCFATPQSEALAGFWNWPILRRPGWIAAGLIALALVNSMTRHGIQPISAKFNAIQVGSNFEFEKWNSFSRILASRSASGGPQLWGPSPVMPKGLTIERRLMNIDGFAGTTMPRFSGDLQKVDYLRYDITNLAYNARTNPKVAIIGVGSGRDLLSAHLFGARDITGVELNPIFIDLLRDPKKLRAYAGIADIPGVHLYADEGRSWFARTRQKFDLLQMSMIDTFAATGAGAFSLSENGLYTVEGWKIFLSALNPNGLFTVSRWHAASAPIEIGRTTSLAVASLFALGVERPRDHIFIATVGNLATVVVGRAPLTADELRTLTEVCDRMEFHVLADPRRAASDNVIRDLLDAKSPADLKARAARYWLDLSPPSDARPFFFNQLRIFNLQNWKFFANEYSQNQRFARGESLVVVGNIVAISTLFLLIVLSAGAVVATVMVPARSSIYNVERRLAWLGSVYFLLIGLGFMFVEIGLIQRISVFLGHPIYALGIVLFSIILSTGIGSMLSERLKPSSPVHVACWLGALVAYLFFLPNWLPAFAPVESARLLVRAAVSVAVILPAGVLMGFGFPMGMKLVMKWDGRPTPWFWGVNGTAGVLAAGLSVACSIAFSIDTTLRLGAMFYWFLLPTALLLMRGGGVATPTATVPADAATGTTARG